MSLLKFGEIKFSRELVFKWIRRIVGLSLAVSYIVAVYLVICSNILPMKYIMVIAIISGALVSCLLYFNFKNKLSIIKTILLIIVSLLMIFVSIYIYSISRSTTSFLNKIQNDGYTFIDYNIIAKKSQHIKLDLAERQTVGILANDENNSAVIAQVNKLTKADYVKLDNITSQTVSLDTNASNMLVLNSSYMDLLKENNDSFYKSIEVLATFKTRIKTIPSNKTADVTKPFVVYISGIDTYGQISTVSRSDVNILAIVNPQTHKILLVNTPRDYYVQLHGTTGIRDKLTHAGVYGIDMSINTLEDLYSTQIDYYLRVNFSSLTNIVETLNGVTVNSNYAFSSGKYSFTVGNNQLNGEQALAFSRTRYAFASGDRTRGENQQLVIEAIISKINNPSTLLNYQQILASTQTAMQTNLKSDDMTTLIRNQLNGMYKWTVESTAVDGNDSHNYTYSMGNIKLYVMEPNQVSVDTAKLKIQQYLGN